MDGDKEYEECKLKFEQYFVANILPKLMVLENNRKKMLRIFLLMAFFAFAWLGYVFLRKLCISEELPEMPPYMGFAGCMMILAACFPMFNYYSKSKESLLSLLVSFWGDFSYTQAKAIPEKLLYDSKIMKQYDKFATDDCFEGTFDTVSISINEYILYKEKYIKTNTGRMLTYQKDRGGILFAAKMNKSFSGQTIVVKDKGWLNNLTSYGRLEKAGIESPEFEKVFEVYTDNQVEARYLLTTAMLENILKLKSFFPKIEFSFYQQNVLINIETKKNLFECSSFFRSVINKKRINKTFDELYLLFSIIKILRLNQKTIL